VADNIVEQTPLKKRLEKTQRQRLSAAKAKAGEIVEASSSGLTRSVADEIKNKTGHKVEDLTSGSNPSNDS